MKNFKTFVTEDQELLLMSAASDKRENDIMKAVKALGYDASIPTTDPIYSDVLVKNPGGKHTRVWIEVKMNHSDQLGNVRASYDGRKWYTAPESKGPLKGKMGPLKLYISKLLDRNASSFVKDVLKFTGKKKLSTNIGPQKKDPDTVNLEEMKSFLATQKNQYIVSVSVNDLDKAIMDHYSKGGKAEPAFYLQAGDDFYRLSKEDPLGVATDVPMFSGKGDFRMRVSIRSKQYEIQPELKVNSMPSSAYSLLPGTSKKNPFTHNRVRTSA
tara:strand:- start:21 stop:830 length:810 start_codon:yes stop_codon:yes gene_type:complete